MKKNADDRENAAPRAGGLRRILTVVLVCALPLILIFGIGVVSSLISSVRTYRDIGVFPGKKPESIDIIGDMPAVFGEEDISSAADAVADYTNGCKMTLLSVEYGYELEDYLESKCPDYPDNCRMILHCYEYNYGDDAANVRVHSRLSPWAVVVRDSESAPWRVIEHGYL